MILSVGNGHRLPDLRHRRRRAPRGPWPSRTRTRRRSTTAWRSATPQRGLALSDPVDGVFRLQETTRRRAHLVARRPVRDAARRGPTSSRSRPAAPASPPARGRPPTSPRAVIDPPRIFVSQDRGHTWIGHDGAARRRPVGRDLLGAVPGPSQRHRGRRRPRATPPATLGNAAWSNDGGPDVAACDGPSPSGYRSGSAWLPGDRDVALAVGPSGSDVTTDAGRTWSVVRHRELRQRRVRADGACWASGEQGRVARLAVSRD